MRPTRQHVVVVSGERTSAWRLVVCLLESGFCLEVDQGTVHLMVGSSAEVEVVAGKFSSNGKVF